MTEKLTRETPQPGSVRVVDKRAVELAIDGARHELLRAGVRLPIQEVATIALTRCLKPERIAEIFADELKMVAA